MSPALPTIERGTNYLLNERPRSRDEMIVENVFHRSISELVDYNRGYTNLTSTTTEAALDIMSQIGQLELGRSSQVVILGTATSGIPYAPLMESVIKMSMVDAPRLKSGYLLVKRNVTHPDKDEGTIIPEVKEYVASRGYESVKQEEIERLQKTYIIEGKKPNAVVLFDETEWSGGTTIVGREMLTDAFGENVPVISLTRKGDLPWDYEGHAKVVVEKDADGAEHLAIQPAADNTRDAFRTVGEETIRFIQEAVRGQHPKLVEAYSKLDFDVTGDKKYASLVEKSQTYKEYVQAQVDQMKARKDPVYQPLIDAMEDDLAGIKRDFEEDLVLYGLKRTLR